MATLGAWTTSKQDKSFPQTARITLQDDAAKSREVTVPTGAKYATFSPLVTAAEWSETGADYTAKDVDGHEVPPNAGYRIDLSAGRSSPEVASLFFAGAVGAVVCVVWYG